MDRTPVSLLERIRTTAASADWARFVRLFAPVILQVARRSGLQNADAADLVQDVLLVLSQRMRDFQYDQSRSFRAWLRVVTLNKLRENLRRKSLSTKQAYGDLLDQVATDDPTDFTDEEEYREMIAARALHFMQAEFSPTTWRACWEHVVSGRKAAEIAAELGISEGAVYAAKCRVLQRLRQELDGLLD